MTYGHQMLLVRVFTASALVLAGLATGAGTTGASQAQAANSDPELQRFYSQTVSWQPCSGRSPRSQCATVTVPLDYLNPAGRTIEVALLKVPATGSDSRALLVNPGGPGASGLDFAEYLSSVLGPDARNMYDVVGFDPRGVGQSAPVRCLTGTQTTQWYRTDSTPDTAQERRTLLNRATAIARGCLNHDPELARNIGSTNTVKDMDIIRQALAQDTLNWFGFSYGTTLGALYAQEFPERVGRMVLDGGVDPRLDAMQLSKGQSDGFQLAVRRFAADCARRSDCVASSQPGVLRSINRLLKTLDDSPLRTDGPRRLVQAEALSALFFSMYSTRLWPTLRSGLRQASRGNGTTLQLLAQLSRDQVGPDRYGSNLASAFYAIACWDFPPTPGVAGLSAAARSWSRGVVVPEMARAMSWGNAPCSNWFGHSPVPPQAVSSTTQAPILIIGTQFDPATPYAWSQALSDQLTTSRLLTYRGDGHTAYGGMNLCVDGITNRYLTTGELPDPGTSCSG
jgi:pimeloyl-ACP methyl ester carboxylesterase